MPTRNSAVMPMPPCSWIDSCPMCRPPRLTCRPTRAAASATSTGSPAATTIVAQSTRLWVSSSEVYMSAARKVSAWKLFSVTPNCLRLVRYSVVAFSWVCIAPSDWLAAITRPMSCTVAMLLVTSSPGLAERGGGGAVEHHARGPTAVVAWRSRCARPTTARHR